MKSLFTIAGVIACLALFVFLVNSPVIVYTIYGLSFIVTILFRIYYERIEVTEGQAEIYSAITTIVTMALFYAMITKRPTYADHSALLLIISAIIGLLNIGCALQLKNLISNNSNL